MSSFSPTDAALEGIELFRTRPRAVLAWAVCYLAFSLLAELIAFVTLGAHFGELLAEVRNPTADTAEFSRVIAQTWPFFAVDMPVYLAFQAMFSGAVYRAVLGPEESGGPWLRLGGAELRLIAVNLIMTAVWTAFLFVVLLAFAIMAQAPIGGGAMLGLFTLLTILSIVGAVQIFVRLSLAGSATYAQGRLVVFRSWSLTLGHFWGLLGAYVMAGAIAGMAMVLTLSVFAALVELLRLATGVSISALAAGPASAPVFMAALVSQAVTSLAFTGLYVILRAAPARAYRELTAEVVEAA